MMSWVSLLLEAVLAFLMIALIVYCIRLNRRLTLLRSQNAEFTDMMAGLREASERAEQSVQHLKATGLSVERSLRSAIEDAGRARADLSRLLATASPVAAPSEASEQPVRQQGMASAAAASRRKEPRGEGRRGQVKRDMLLGEPSPASGDTGMARPPAGRPRTREEAEETVLQVIRSARTGS